MSVIDAHFTWEDDPAQHEPLVLCDVCGVKLCTVEEGDTFSMIAAVVADHAHETHGTP